MCRHSNCSSPRSSGPPPCAARAPPCIHRPNDPPTDPPTDPSIDSFIHPFVRSWDSQSDQPRAEGSASQKEEEPKGDQGKSSPTRGAERTAIDMDARIPNNDSTTSSIQSNPHLLSFSTTLLQQQQPTHLAGSPYSPSRRSMACFATAFSAAFSFFAGDFGNGFSVDEKSLALGMVGRGDFYLLQWTNCAEIADRMFVRIEQEKTKGYGYGGGEEEVANWWPSN